MEDTEELRGNAPTNAGDVSDELQQQIAARVRAQLFARPPAPEKLGRFTLIEEIGRGGMGTVHAAHDDRLDRKVAIKVLRRDDLPSEAARARLLREAQAMARLNHPNVLPIYDVGHDEGVVFIAMELVEGQTLQQWLGDGPRPWPQVLPRFVQAARGLQAAHEAGVVHRDFKPGNVMLDDAGRVRVMDFGLARLTDEQELEESVPSGGAVSMSSHVGSLTRTGTVLGSPYFMAPEQHLGLQSDARSDQYAFCVALWFAAYGVWPFEAEELKELCEAKMRRPPSLPGDHAAPRWLAPLLIRGLSAQPDDRFDSMAELLRRLEGSERPPSRWRVAGIGLGISVLAVAGGISLGDSSSKRPCEGAGDRLQGVWDRAAAAEVEAAVERTGLPYAQASWTRLSALLDEYTDALSAGYVDACEATVVDHEQSEALMEARMRCLDDRRDQLAGLREALTTNGPDLLPRSVLAARRLPSIDSCADPKYVESEMLPADEGQEREQLAALRSRLARTRALMLASDYDAAMTIAREVRAEAKTLGHAPLVAETGHVIGDIHLDEGRVPEALEIFRETYFGAAERGQHELKAEIATHMVYVLGYRQAKHDEAQQWIKHASADIDRLGDERARARLLNNRGLVLVSAGHYEDALAAYREALEIRERLGDPEFPQVATLVNNMGIAYKSLGRAKEAQEAFERAVAIRDEELGSEHPSVASTLNNVAVALVMQANYEEAEAVYRKVLSIMEPIHGADHVDVARTRFNLGNLLRDVGRYDEALEAHQRALDARERGLGELHPDVAASLNSLGMTYGARGQSERALEYYRRALKVREQILDPSHPAIGGALNNIGNVLKRRGELDEALASFERAAKLLEEGLGPEHPHVGIVTANVGDVHAAREHYELALVQYHRALSIAETSGGPEHPEVANVLGLIGAVYLRQERFDEALELERRALAIVEKTLGGSHPSVADRSLALGRVLLERGDAEAALEPLERAVSVAEAHEGTPRAEARFVLARALARTGKLTRARRLAKTARDDLRAKTNDAALVEEIETWLRVGPSR